VKLLRYSTYILYSWHYGGVARGRSDATMKLTPTTVVDVKIATTPYINPAFTPPDKSVANLQNSASVYQEPLQIGIESNPLCGTVETFVDAKPSYPPGSIYDIDIHTASVNLTYRATRRNIKMIRSITYEGFTIQSSPFRITSACLYYSGFLSMIIIIAAIMLSKLSIITLLAATSFTSALPADYQKSISRRQEDWNICFVPALVNRFYLLYF
jgi:hypothetical protein